MVLPQISAPPHTVQISENLKQSKVAGDKGISKTKLKQQSPCSNCMHQTVPSWGSASITCMHKPVRCMHWSVTSQADACIYCMGSKVSSLSQIYLYSSYFESNVNSLVRLDVYGSSQTAKPIMPTYILRNEKVL